MTSYCWNKTFCCVVRSALRYRVIQPLRHKGGKTDVLDYEDYH